MNNAKTGDVGESAAIFNFTRKGIMVAKPLFDNSPYDLIIDLNGELKKIQVKTARGPELDGSKIQFKIDKTKWTGNGLYDHNAYNQNDFDYYYLYCKKNNMSFLVERNESISDHKISIRLTEPKNNQKTGINMAEDFEFDKIIDKILTD